MGPWSTLRIKPLNSTANVTELDNQLTSMLPAAVTQHMEYGKYFHQADADGTYEARVFDELDSFTVRLAKAIIEQQHNDILD
jgi:hypothetical protein